MIPKIIHYCWLSSNNIDDKFLDCKLTWENNCKDYKFIHWGPECIEKFCKENEFFNKYYSQKNYAFCADFVRFYALYHYGGFYVDCDVKLYENFDRVTDLKRFIGLECFNCNGKYIINNSNIEIGIMGCEKHDKFIKYCLDVFNDINCYETEHIIGPDIASRIIKYKYEYKLVKSIQEAKEYESDNKIAIFNKPGFDRCYFKYNGTGLDYRIAHHCFYNSWVADYMKINFNSKNKN